jgi:small subunit ribosomal protein S16
LATKIRLRRIGAKKKPFYRFVVADSRCSRDGKFIEAIGTYNPLEKPAKILLKEDRAYYWLSKGAVPTDTANALFRQIGLLKKWRMMKKKEDVSGLALSATIVERKKKRKKKKVEAAPQKQKEAKPAKDEEKKVEEKPEGEKKSE